MESNVGRQTLVSESVSVPAPRERQPTPVATRSLDVSRAEPTSTVVLTSHTWEGRSSDERPEIHARSEVVSKPEVEIPATFILQRLIKSIASKSYFLIYLDFHVSASCLVWAKN